MRTAARSTEIAGLAVRYRDEGVVGFDIAGAEAGYPPTLHLDAFEYLHRENFHFTIHAGEAFGLPSIWQAIQWCGADRLGHGVRIVDDISVGDISAGDTSADGPHGDGARHGKAKLGRLAAYVRDKRIPLELCPSSNVQTGAATSIATHPIGLLRDLRFRVTVNTDNRLMSDTSMTQEMALLVEAFGYGWSDLQWFTINAMKSAFIPFDERLAIINEIIKPGYAKLL
jgi:adenosine deaminase